MSNWILAYLTDTSDPYFSPFSLNDQQKRIIIQFEKTAEETKSVIKSIFAHDILEELTEMDTKKMLQRCIKAEDDKSSIDLIHKILIYPPEVKGGISINTEDYMCLAVDQYLNDVIIDFYLKYVLMEFLTESQRQRTHVFSTFFYKRLTTLTTKHRGGDKDAVKLTAAQKRHERVKNWTKNDNLFEKDFIIIPINEQSHWFLAIICFPALKGPVTFEGGTPVKPAPLPKKKNTVERKSVSLQIGSTTITPVSKMREADSICLEDDGSERDEAEGDDSDMASDDSEAEPEPSIQPIKQ